MAQKKSQNLGMNTIKMFTSLLPTLVQSNKETSTGLQSRMDLIDAYIEKDSARDDKAVKGKIVNELGDKTKMGATEIAICKIQLETFHAYLTGMFLTGSPIFAAVSDKELEDAASMLTALTLRDQERMGWVANLLQCFNDLLRYPFCAAEVVWETRRGTAVAEKLESSGNSKLGVVNPVIYEGNMIRRIDPKNVIRDPSVHPFRCHIDGTYAGYIEKLNYIQLKLRYLMWDDLFTIKANIPEIWKSTATGLYYTPPVRTSGTVSSGGQNWADFWGMPKLTTKTDVSGNYEVVTLYARLIPREFGMPTTNDGQPQLYKLIFVNTLLAYSELITQSHEYLPIVFGQLEPGSVDLKSMCEDVMDLQDLSTSFMNAALDSMRRAVSDRAIYDPTRISKAAIESTSPVSKIPVKVNAYQNGLDNAYKQIPYEDRISGNMTSMMALLEQLANKTTGQNPASQGTFQKGNKTRSEFDTVMNNSEARMQLGAMYVEGSFLAPIKEIIKFNYLLNASSETVQHKAEQKKVNIDPTVLRQSAPEFQMASGIMPATKLANTDLLFQAYQLMGQDPMLSIEYDTGAMFVSAIKQQGLTGMESYKRSEEEVKNRLALIQQQAQASTPPKEAPQQ